jgi:hypothetical protein
MVTIYRAWTETPRFEWNGYGLTPQSASRDLRAKLEEHGKKYGIEPREWWLDVLTPDDTKMFKINIGNGFSTEEPTKNRVIL